MPGSETTWPMREVVLRRDNLDIAEMYVAEFSNIRDKLSAWEWEAALLSARQLNQLRDQPCQESLDSQLIVVTNDWLSRLQGLWNREIRSPNRQILHQRPYAFAGLFNMVYAIQQLVYLYYWGDIETCRTPEHHTTIWPGMPRTDVTQARFTIATLAKFGFCAWLEDLLKDPNAPYPPTGAMIYDFHFNCETRVLSWANVNEGGIVLPRQRLHLVFPEHDDQDEGHQLEHLRSMPWESKIEFVRPIISWLMKVSDKETFPSNGAVWDIHSCAEDSYYDDESTLLDWSDQESSVDSQPDDDDDGDENHDEYPHSDGDGGWRYNEEDDDNDNDYGYYDDDDDDRDNGGYRGFRPYYGCEHDDLLRYYHRSDEDDEEEDDQDSGYESSLLFSLTPSDNGYDDGIWIDNTSDSGYGGSINGDKMTDSDKLDDKPKKEKETAVAVYRPTDSETVTTTEDTITTTEDTETATTSSNSDEVHDTFVDALERPMEGNINNMFAYINRLLTQRQPPAYREHDSDAPPAYDDDVPPPAYSFD
ncbi:hypothetical protein F5Y06DRAFT_29888 [Hypoxylon sp. FL0890]|nr:hypothetical protein F5Y06DRAFT_29888 [Hypoxylon sp. FL0890]